MQTEKEKEETGVFDLLNPQLQQALKDTGYSTPTPIQTKAIPPILSGRDLIGCAQTGTGKTAAFVLPILHRMGKNRQRPLPGKPRILIMAPTRELAAQIGESIATYGKHVHMTRTVVFGGVKAHLQIKSLKKGKDFLVATPGRLLDLMNQGFINLENIEVFVLDEADRMLDMGFINDIKKVMAKLPNKRQTLFFSATLAQQVIKLAISLVHNPIRISITPERPAVEKIEQKIYFVESADKDRLLQRLLAVPTMTKVLVFVQMKHRTTRVVKKLTAAGIPAVSFHSDKTQNARIRALEDFKSDAVRVLVATDIAARGLDVDNITHVINYSLPNEPEVYVHRIGRTARAGAGGDAISFCSSQEKKLLSGIEDLIRTPIKTVTDHPFHSDVAENTGTSSSGSSVSRRKSSRKQDLRVRQQRRNIESSECGQFGRKNSPGTGKRHSRPKYGRRPLKKK